MKYIMEYFLLYILSAAEKKIISTDRLERNTHLIPHIHILQVVLVERVLYDQRLPVILKSKIPLELLQSVGSHLFLYKVII